MKQFENFVLTNVGKANILAITFKSELAVKTFLEQTKESCFVSPVSPNEILVVPDEFLDDCENAYMNIIDPKDFIDNL